MCHCLPSVLGGKQCKLLRGGSAINQNSLTVAARLTLVVRDPRTLNYQANAGSFWIFLKWPETARGHPKTSERRKVNKVEMVQMELHQSTSPPIEIALHRDRVVQKPESTEANSVGGLLTTRPHGRPKINGLPHSFLPSPRLLNRKPVDGAERWRPNHVVGSNRFCTISDLRSQNARGSTLMSRSSVAVPAVRTTNSGSAALGLV